MLTDTPMTRAALGEALATQLGNEAFADRVTSSWGTFLKPAASRGLLCFGPDDGRNVTFVDPRAWLGREMPEPSEDAHRRRHRAPAHRVPRQLARASSRAGGASRAARRCASRSRRSATASSRSWRTARRCSSASDDVAELAQHRAVDRASACCPASTRTRSSLQKEAEPLLPLARRPLVSRTAGWISQVVIVGGAVAAHVDARGEEGPARDRGRAVAAADEGRADGDRRARRRGSARSWARSPT